MCMANKQYNMASYITSDFDFDKGGYIIQIEWTEALYNIVNPCSKLEYTEVREVH